jgi:hypothetical protein
MAWTTTADLAATARNTACASAAVIAAAGANVLRVRPAMNPEATSAATLGLAESEMASASPKALSALVSEGIGRK